MSCDQKMTIWSLFCQLPAEALLAASDKGVLWRNGAVEALRRASSARIGELNGPVAVGGEAWETIPVPQVVGVLDSVAGRGSAFEAKHDVAVAHSCPQAESGRRDVAGLRNGKQI